MLFLYVLTGYLLGSVPFGLIIGKIWNIDIRKYGSGNIGATNVYRSLGAVPGTMVLLLDFLKGAAAVYLGYWAGGEPQVVLALGISVIFGHMFSIFLGFKGGRGAATGLGVLLGLTPDIFIVSAVFAALLIIITRYVSVASIFTPFLTVTLMFFLHKPLPYSVAALLVAIFIVIRHFPNITRLLQGTEPRI